MSIRHTIVESIREINRFKIKIWLTSKGTKEDILALCHEIEIFGTNTEDFTISKECIQDLREEFQNVYKKLKSILFQKETASALTIVDLNESFNETKVTPKKYSFFINGKSLPIIISDKYLSLNFTFFIHFCDVLIVYNIDPHEKQLLAQIIKQNYPSSSLLAIGSSTEDTLMCQIADTGIMVHNKFRSDQNTLKKHTGDVIVSEFSKINELLFRNQSKVVDDLRIVVTFLFEMHLFIFVSLFFRVNTMNFSTLLPIPQNDFFLIFFSLFAVMQIPIQ